MGDKPWHSRKKPCHKCEKETKLALKCEHCGAMQQWDWSDQMFFFKSLSSKWKALYAVGLIVVCYLSFTVSYSFFSSDNSTSRSRSNSSSAKTCKLSGCNRSGNGWRFYTGSDLGAYSYSCVRLGPSTGHSYNYTYCSKAHCAADR